MKVALGQHSVAAHRAARQSSFIDHPVAVPFLAKVLESSYFGREVAIEALARDTPEAVDPSYRPNKIPHVLAINFPHPPFSKHRC